MDLVQVNLRSFFTSSLTLVKKFWTKASAKLISVKCDLVDCVNYWLLMCFGVEQASPSCGQHQIPPKLSPSALS